VASSQGLPVFGQDAAASGPEVPGYAPFFSLLPVMDPMAERITAYEQIVAVAIWPLGDLKF
jgi:hypothetical protein